MRKSSTVFFSHLKALYRYSRMKRRHCGVVIRISKSQSVAAELGLSSVTDCEIDYLLSRDNR